MIARAITIVLLPLAMVTTFAVVLLAGIFEAFRHAFNVAMLEIIPAKKMWRTKSIRREHWK